MYKKLILLSIFILGGYYGFSMVQRSKVSVHGDKQVWNSVSASQTQTVQEKEFENQKPTVTEVVRQIAETFNPEGPRVIVSAINCALSESKLNAFAVNDKNRNKTIDGGVFQINDVWHMPLSERLDYKKNIAKAYQIYKRSNTWNSWYGSLCRAI